MNSEFGPNDSAVDAYLHKLRNNKWFEKVGAPVNDEQVVIASSWEDANRLFRTEVNSGWNKMATDVLNRAPRRQERLSAFNLAWKIAWDATCNTVRDAARNIGLAAMEIVVADLIESTYFRDLADWYLKGRWPSGYVDDCGKKRIVIY